MRELQRLVLGAVVAEHCDGGLPAVQVGGGLRLGAIDGSVTRTPDTKANREESPRDRSRHAGAQMPPEPASHYPTLDRQMIRSPVLGLVEGGKVAVVPVDQRS